MKPKEIDKIISCMVSSKIDELKGLCAKDLLSLPSYTSIKFEVAGKTKELGIWHDKLDGGESLIVAQCKNTYFLGIGNMYAEGFVLSTSGQIQSAPEKLMWQYT